MDKSKQVKGGAGVSNQAAPEWTGDKPKPAAQPAPEETRTEEDRKLRRDISRPYKGVGSI
jgi:hypothetical protein